MFIKVLLEVHAHVIKKLLGRILFFLFHHLFIQFALPVFQTLGIPSYLQEEAFHMPIDVED